MVYPSQNLSRETQSVVKNGIPNCERVKSKQTELLEALWILRSGEIQQDLRSETTSEDHLRIIVAHRWNPKSWIVPQIYTLNFCFS